MRFYLTATGKTDKTWKRQDKDKKTSKKDRTMISYKPWTRQDKEKLNTLFTDSEKIRQDLNETIQNKPWKRLDKDLTRLG